MIQGDVIHTVSGANFSNYWYVGVMVAAGATATINGTAVAPGVGGPITVPVGISSASQISASGDVYLIGRKKFGATSGTTGFWENPLSNDTGNAKGTFSIR